MKQNFFYIKLGGLRRDTSLLNLATQIRFIDWIQQNNELILVIIIPRDTAITTA